MSKIVHVCEYVKGGIATHLQELLKHQIKDHQITVILPEEHRAFIEIPDAVDVLTYPYRRSFLNALRTSFLVYKILKALSPDLVHCHSSFAGVMTRAPFIFFKKFCPVVYCAHGWSFNMELSPWKKKVYVLIERFLSRYTDRIVNISEHEQAITLALGFAPDKMQVIYNFLSASFSRETIPDIVARQSVIKAAFVGRFDRQKGIDYLLSEFENVKRRDIALYLVGEQVLEGKKLTLPLDDRIVPLGWLSHDRVIALINSVDVLIMPSRWEGFGLVAIEAMRAGKTVLASDRGALPEIIIHDKTGLIFPLETGSLSLILEQVQLHDLQRYGKNGMENFAERFDARNALIKYDELYLNLI